MSDIIRRALTTYLAVPPSNTAEEQTRSGRLLSEFELSNLASEAEAGYDLATLRTAPSHRPVRAQVVPVRLAPELKAAVEQRAEQDATSVSDVIRSALHAGVASALLRHNTTNDRPYRERVVEPTVRLTTAAGSDKPLVRTFLSYAKRDTAVVGRLWKLLAAATGVDRVYRFELWRFDEAILVGEDWDAQVRDALAASELGLLAVSNAFLGSAYITGVELPALVDVPGKRAIPVSVRRLSCHADLQGLAGKQIYGYPRPFGEVRGLAGQEAWVNGLVDHLHRVLDRYSVPGQRSGDGPRGGLDVARGQVGPG